MELEVEVDAARAIGNLTFDTTETDAVFLLLAHLPGLKKDEIEVQIDEAKMEIKVSGGGQIESLEYVNVDGLVNIGRVVEMGRFCYVFSIPDGVVFERIDASFNAEEEILLILIPKLGREIVPTRAVVDEAEEEEVSCDVDKQVSVEEQPEPIPIPLPDQSEEQGNESEEEEIPNEEIPDQMPNLPDSVENGNHDVKAEDPLNLVEEGDLRESESAQSPITSEEESDEKSKEEEENLSFEAEDPHPEAPKEIESPEMDMNFNFIIEREEQDPETTRNRKSEESDSKCEDENPTIENEDPTRQAPEPIKSPETDISFTLIEEQEPKITQNHKSEESNLDSTLEHENATIEAENPPPKIPESTKPAEIDMNFYLAEEQEMQESETVQNPRSEDPDQVFKQDQDLPPKTSEPIKSVEMDTDFSPTQEQEEQEPESNQNTEAKGPDQSSDKGSDEALMRRKRRRSPTFHLNATSLLAGSAFLFSLVVLVFHFLRRRKQSKP